jgi:hypothetical protein
VRVVGHPEAEEELEAAALWYEARQPGLGDDWLFGDTWLGLSLPSST